jgi:hypothetical protein
MSGYIGNILVPQATQTRDSFIATAGQTSFPTSGYTPNFLDVYLNGIKLHSSDFTATNGSDVVLATGAAVNDVIEVVAYNAFDVASGTFDDLTVNNNIAVSGTVDGRDIAADGTKLDGIESGATGDQTNAEIRAAVEAATDSNVFTDADHTKLNAIEASATADQTAAEIRTLVESATDSNVFTDADHTKLNAIESGATADQTKSDIDALNINADTLDGQHGSYYTSYADTAVANIVDSAPGTLDTLNELAAALGDDPNFATTTATNIAAKLPLAGGTLTGNLSFGNNNKAIFNSDLEVYRTGTDAFIDEKGSGWLYIRGNNTVIGKYTGETYMKGIADGAVELYHNNVKKIETTSTGIDVTGTVTADGIYNSGIYNQTGDAQFWVTNVGEAVRIQQNTGNVGIGTSSPTHTLHVNNSIRASSSLVSIDPTGSASAPALIFGGDDDSGLWRPASNTLAISTAGTERMRIDSSGRVGIGTSSPQTELHVHDSAGLSQIRLSGTASDADTFQLGQGTTGVTNGGFTIRDVEASADRLVINSSGNVGIGESSPAKKFHVHSGNQSDIVKFENDNGGFVLGKTSNLGSLDMASDANFRIRHGGVVSATFKSNGNVGIGDTNPLYQLSVNNGTSDGGIFRLYNEEVGLNVAVDGTTGSPNYTNSSRTVTFNATRMDSGSSPKLRLGGQGGLEFAADANNVRMVINTGGNVGIGTTSPDNTLTVNGGTESFGIQISETERFTLGADGTWNYFKGKSGNGHYFNTTGGGLFVVNNAGNVGIGTSSPTQKLVVSGNVSATAYYGDGSNLTGVGGSTAYNGVGTYVYGIHDSSGNTLTHNTTFAGSTLTALAAFTGNTATASLGRATITSGSLSGTWRSMGGGYDTRASHHRIATLFVRIS